MSDDQFTYDPMTFADESFAAEYSDLFDDFISLSIQGMPRELAIIDAFDMISVGARLDNVKQLALAAQTNPYYKLHFAKRLAATPVEQLWNEKLALNHMRRLVENEEVRESVRLAAIKELCILIGLTVIDDKGNTSRRTLSDLYEDLGMEETLARNRAFVEEGRRKGDKPAATH